MALQFAFLLKLSSTLTRRDAISNIYFHIQHSFSMNKKGGIRVPRDNEHNKAWPYKSKNPNLVGEMGLLLFVWNK